MSKLSEEKMMRRSHNGLIVGSDTPFSVLIAAVKLEGPPSTFKAQVLNWRCNCLSLIDRQRPGLRGSLLAHGNTRLDGSLAVDGASLCETGTYTESAWRGGGRVYGMRDSW